MVRVNGKSYGNYFETAILKVTWYQMFKVLSQQLRDTLTMVFGRHLTV